MKLRLDSQYVIKPQFFPRGWYKARVNVMDNLDERFACYELDFYIIDIN